MKCPSLAAINVNDSFCPAMIPGGKWELVSCKEKLNYICQKNIEKFSLREPKWTKLKYLNKGYYQVRLTNGSSAFIADYFSARYICEHLLQGLSKICSTKMGLKMFYCEAMN